MEYSAGKHDWADGVHIRVVYYRASKLFQKNDRDFFLREYCDRDFYEKSCAAFSAGYAEAVSYTHLDVYKRQGQARCKWIPPTSNMAGCVGKIS